MRKLKRGSSLVETGLSIGLMGMLMIGFAVQQGEQARKETDNLIAERLQEVQGWLVKYLDGNAGQLANGIALGITISIPLMSGGPGAGYIQSFEEMGFVPEGYRDVNALGQKHAILLRQSSPGSLTALVVQIGGRPASDVSLGRIIRHVGTNGGGRFSKPPPGQTSSEATIFGAGGGWTLDSGQWIANGISVETGHAVARASVKVPVSSISPPLPPTQENHTTRQTQPSESFNIEIR